MMSTKWLKFEKRRREFKQIKCIKDESDRFLVKDEEINNR
jgi:hypothetical protein